MQQLLKRLNEFLQTEPAITNTTSGTDEEYLKGDIVFKDVSFTYAHTEIKALTNLISQLEGRRFLFLDEQEAENLQLRSYCLHFTILLTEKFL